MPKQKEFEMPPDIPSWVMTFSDVITLLMTFFILLLTFASSTPEKFEQVKVSMFAGGGATGIVGTKDTGMERDSVLMRERSKAGRLTTRGSEMPPLEADAAISSLGKGIAGLEDAEKRKLSTQHAFTVPLSLFVDSEGKVTSIGKQHLHMVARHMRKKPIKLSCFVGNETDLVRAQALSQSLFEEERIAPGQLALGMDNKYANRGSYVTLILTKSIRKSLDGS